MRSRYCNNTGIEDVFNVLATGSVFSLASDRRCSFVAGTKLSLFYFFFFSLI